MQKFDGYTDYSVDQKDINENFTITITFNPYSYETVMSGLLSCFSVKEKQGLAIAIGKGGKVQAKFGDGKNIYDIKNLRGSLKYQKANIVTFSYWADAGWCDLCINGELSNRLQLARHKAIIFPSEKFYIGRYVDGCEFTDKSRRGFFHGCIYDIRYTDEYMPFNKVLEEHEKTDISEEQINLYNEEKVKEDIYRPSYHLMPPGKWMNEPHAPFFYEGNYHIFYQANPHAPIWDNLCWGHLVSKDMVSWKYAGITLNPDSDNNNETDPDGCWSGSACLDESGRPMIFYTAGNNKKLPNQSVALAVPADLNDEMLKEWNKEGVILSQGLDEGFVGEFRDPFVFRRGDKYFILVGSGDSQNGGGNALVYETHDFKDFICHGFIAEYDFYKHPEVGHVWELPVLLPLRNEKGDHVCDILLLCACQVEDAFVETYYFLGDFDEESGKFTILHEEPRLIDLGHGTFTGPSGFVTPDGRSILFTIAQGRRGADEYDAGWAHNGGMPVELSISKGKLAVNPIREVKGYFTKECGMDETLLKNMIEASTKGNYLEIVLGFSGGGYKISYDRLSCEFMALDIVTNKKISIFRGNEDKVNIDGEPVLMEVLIDHSMIEVYLNHKKSMTLRCYKYDRGYELKVNSDKEYFLNVRGMM